MAKGTGNQLAAG